MNTPTQQRIESLVTRLIDGQLISEDGQIKEIDGLLHQLRASVINTFDSGTGSGSRNQGSKPPLALNALAVLDEIERDATYILPGHFPNVETRILSLLIRVDEVGETRALKWLESLTQKIENLFAPRRMVEITSPCPSCGETRIYRTDSAGDIIRSFALQAYVDTDNEGHAECLNCGDHWHGFREVARLSRTLTFQSC